MRSFEERWPTSFHETIHHAVHAKVTAQKHIKVAETKVFDTEIMYARAMGLQSNSMDFNHLSIEEDTVLLQNSNHIRAKRSFFALTNGTRLRFNPTLTLPIPSMSDIVSAQIDLRIPDIQYFLYTGFAGRNSAADQLSLFRYAESALEKAGLNGRGCIRRFICEIGEIPNHDMGMVGDIIDIVFSVIKSENEISDEMEDYIKAEQFGRYRGNCAGMYNSCPISLFKIQSILSG
ncbi:hypothetical protein GQR58_005752 [Nymphon striatum]|nr:hypothetical protein GQR58_005752 [Nymphon striatum]